MSYERHRALQLLEEVDRAPKMYASCKEAFLAICATAVEIVDQAFDGCAFYRRHLNVTGNIMTGVLDDFDVAWARAVVADARLLLENSK